MGPLDAKRWLRLLAGSMPTPPVGINGRLSVYAERLAADFRASAFTAAAARKCGAMFQQAPDYPTLAAALRQAMPGPDAAPRGPRPEAEIVADSWGSFIARRLGEGADPARLLSLLRAHAPKEALPDLLATHFPAVVEADARHAAEVVRDKARAMEASAAKLRAALAPPPAPKGAAASAPAPPPEPTGPKPRLIEGEQLARLRAADAAKLGLPLLRPVQRSAPDPAGPAEAPRAAPTGQRALEDSKP